MPADAGQGNRQRDRNDRHMCSLWDSAFYQQADHGIDVIRILHQQMDVERHW
jgi:plasmid stabilization system protein ParE